MTVTISEQLFEQLCNNRHIRFEPISAVVGHRTPDYRIWLDRVETIVEVKQIDPSRFEHELIALADNEDAPAIRSNVHIRIRNKFDNAKRQLKNLSRGCLPSLLVLYDNTKGLSGLDDEDFMNAMHGEEVLEIYSTKGGDQQKILKTNHTFGKRFRKVGKAHNRSVSGLCWLFTDIQGDPRLRLYHNEFASNPLKTEVARVIAHKQFIRPPSKSNQYREWIELKVS